MISGANKRGRFRQNKCAKIEFGVQEPLTDTGILQVKTE